MTTSGLREVTYTLVKTGMAIDNLKTGSIQKPNASVSSVALFCNLLPSILTTIASAIGLIVLNAFQHHYFSIACAIGTVTGGLTIYQAHCAQQLRTFAANNSWLQNSIADLITENSELKESVDAFTEENNKLKDAVSRLGETSESLKNENTTLSESNTVLITNVAELESVRKNLKDQANTYVERLEALQGSLSGIQHSTEKDHTQFAQYVESFILEVKKLQDTSAELDAGSATIEKTMVTLQDIFTKINQWKDDKYHEHLIQTQQTLSAQVLELEKQIARSEIIEQAERRNIEELAMLKDSFERSLQVLIAKVGEFSNIADDVVNSVQHLDGFNQQGDENQSNDIQEKHEDYQSESLESGTFTHDF